MSAEKIPIDPDISRAATLPSALYTDETWYALTVERVLARGWHLLMEAGAAAAPGDLVPVTLLPGSLDEPLLLARDKDGTEALLGNVCTHRGNLLCDAPTSSELVRCGYHGRCFALDGRCISAPGFEGAHDFPAPSDNLPRLPLERWGPFAFTSLDPGHTIRELLGPVQRRLSVLPLDELVFDADGSRDYELAAHWALYVDNYLEGFHIPFVHPGLARVVDSADYRVETLPWGVLQIAYAIDDDPALDLPEGHQDRDRRIAAYYLWLWPTTMLNFYPWGVSVNLVQPLGPGRTRVRFLSYVSDPELRTRGAGAALDEVELQDEQIVERVAKGLRSRLFQRGRYAPSREIGVHHFHRLLGKALG